MASFARSVGPLGVAYELVGMEIDLAQVARRVAPGLVVEMGRAGMAALAAGRDRQSPDTRSELDDRDEAVAAGAVPALRARPGARAERSERPPPARSERNRDARPGVGEGLHDVAGQALEAVDLAPRCPPAAEIALEPVD